MVSPRPLPPASVVVPTPPVAPRAIVGRAVPRAEVVPQRIERPVIVAPRAVPRVYVPSYYGGYYGYRPGYRPYVFRPFSRTPFGLFLGYPVPYAYAFPYAVPVYGYGAPVAPVYITPSSTQYGGIALDITPPDGQVYVDGNYVGTVHDFDGVGAPLNVTAGRHHIDVTAPGYATLSFDVDVIAGQLVPYRGEMQPTIW